MPSEKDLHDEFGLARETVRRALAVLRAEGLVESGTATAPSSLRYPSESTYKPGDSATSPAAVTVTRANGDIETYPAGTTLAADRLTDAARSAPLNSRRTVCPARVAP